jgi:acetolactate synthase small subunit
VLIPDRPGELAMVTALATERGINVYDVEVAHSVDERGGRLLLVVDSERSRELVEALGGRGRVASAHEL